MIESTPQLFGNAWRVPSACVSSLIAPQLDPCDAHQQAGQFVTLSLAQASGRETDDPGVLSLAQRPTHLKCAMS